MTNPIGQWGQTGQTVISTLKTDGAQLIKTFMIAQVPWLATPWLSWIAGYFADLAAKFIITNLDNGAFAVWVSVRTGKQVSDYIIAKNTGDQAAIDKAADELIHIGKL